MPGQLKGIRVDDKQVDAALPVNQWKLLGEEQSIVLNRQWGISPKAYAPTGARKSLPFSHMVGKLQYVCTLC